MLEYGYDVTPIPDGQSHRFKLPDDKSGHKSGWYICNDQFGAFGDWRKPDKGKVKWSNRQARRRSKQERAEYRRMVAEERRKRRREAALKRSEAANLARSIWAKAKPATEHPYLTRKQIEPHGIRVRDGELVIPLTINTYIHSLQFVTDDRKKFMRDGRVKGCYFPIGKLTNPLWLAEGFATACTVHEVTGNATVCAFNDINLAPVTEHFVEMGLQVYIAADNDKAGWEAAGKARLAGAEYRAAPDMDDGSDWNDFFVLYGKEQTMEGLYGA